MTQPLAFDSLQCSWDLRREQEGSYRLAVHTDLHWVGTLTFNFDASNESPVAAVVDCQRVAAIVESARIVDGLVRACWAFSQGAPDPRENAAFAASLSDPLVFVAAIEAAKAASPVLRSALAEARAVFASKLRCDFLDIETGRLNSLLDFGSDVP